MAGLEKLADSGAAACSPLPPWWLRGRGVEANDYVSQFLSVNPYRPELGRIGMADLVSRMWANNGLYTLVYLPVILVGKGGGAVGLLGGGVAILAVAGWILRVRKPGLPELFLPLYIGLLYVWPEVWAGDRFLLLRPVILGYAAHHGRMDWACPAALGGRRRWWRWCSLPRNSPASDGDRLHHRLKRTVSHSAVAGLLLGGGGHVNFRMVL